MQTVDIKNIGDRVAVHPPYLAFRSLEIDEDTTLYGTFVPEQPIGFEEGPVTAAEIGRHLAILGACAASCAGSPVLTYHLATEAHYKRLCDPLSTADGQTLRASAKILKQERRDLVVDTAVFAGNQFASLRVRYQVLTAPIFTRMFQQFRNLGSSSAFSAQSPYVSLLPLRFDAPGHESVFAHSDALLPDACAGHFPDYPAWPVALVMHCLGRVSTNLLHHLTKRPLTYTVLEADMYADTLVFASQPLTFSAALDHSRRTTQSDYAFTCHAIHEGSVVARLEALVRPTIDQNA